MTEPRRPAALARGAATLLALAATFGGWLALALTDAAPGDVPHDDARSSSPSPLISGAPSVSKARAARRPTPLAITRSSR